MSKSARTIFLVAAEVSGDRLGASLMAALQKKEPGIRFRGVGGASMEAKGLSSLYPMADLSLFGFSDVFKSIFRLRRRIRETVEAILADPPNALVLIDSFGLSFRIAKQVRDKLPGMPIVKYVAPQVWVWREHRAAAMRPYFDHTLALFPFEPEVHARLGGPPCTYTGHPLLEQLGELRPNAEETAARGAKPYTLIVMPGSRRSELRYLTALFGEVSERLTRRFGNFDIVVPTLPHLLDDVRVATASWPVEARVVASNQEKFAAMRRARLAVAASGTATLELALSGVPHVGAYRVTWWEAIIGRILVKVKMALLPNILLNERVVPELLQENCSAEKIAAAAEPLIEDGPARTRQIEAFERLDAILATPEPPSERAAAIVLELLANNRTN